MKIGIYDIFIIFLYVFQIDIFLDKIGEKI